MVLLNMTDEDLDRLAEADERCYWRILSDIVARIENDARWRA
jgi:hypothetical protein